MDTVEACIKCHTIAALAALACMQSRYDWQLAACTGLMVRETCVKVSQMYDLFACQQNGDDLGVENWCPVIVSYH